MFYDLSQTFLLELKDKHGFFSSEKYSETHDQQQ